MMMLLIKAIGPTNIIALGFNPGYNILLHLYKTLTVEQHGISMDFNRNYISLVLR